MAEVGLTRLPDFVVLAQERWDEVERRNQLLVRSLAERNPHSRFLFAEQSLRPRAIRSWRPPRPAQVAPNIWVIQPVRPLPDRPFERVSDVLELAPVRRAARRLGLERPWLWTQDPRVASLVDRLDLGGVLYDLTDDWAAFETDPARRADVQRQIESLARRADVVLACSRSLEQDARTWSDRVSYLPNAVDPPRPPAPPPADIERLPRPRVGYVGTLHPARLDVALLARAVELRPTWSFVLLGPNLLDAADRDRLAHPNVHDLGVRRHGEIRTYLESLDVGLIPHLVNDFTRSLDPLKLYEYLAAGLPVVTTPVGNGPDLQRHVVTAATAEELVDAVEQAIADETTERQEARRAAVAAQTWDARAAELEAQLGVPRRSKPDPVVSAVIVSYNTRELLALCLTELEAQDGVDVEAHVVDNASSDDSVAMVRRRHHGVNVIELPDNAGFARANNVAFARCRGEYVLLLNSDAFLHPGALRELVGAAERHPRAGALGPRLLNPDGTLQRSAWPFPTARRALVEAVGAHRLLRRVGLIEDLGTWSHDEERPVDFLIGACLLLRRDALLEVGGFDEEFWLYGEEADLQRRMTARGWEVVFTPRAVATHVGGASSAMSDTRLRHFYSGQMRFLKKHGGPASWPLARVALFVGSALRGRWTSARVALTLRG